jgi:hypothetical protein
VIAVGERAPNVPVWPSLGSSVRVHDLAPADKGLLLLFYLFDWSST